VRSPKEGALPPAATSGTIAGLSADAPSPLCVLRLSGPLAIGIAQRIFRGRLRAPGRHSVGHLIDPTTERPIDEAIAVFYVAPHSYTREDVVEITIRGGKALTDWALAAALNAGARPAAPGEFTRRAVTNGRIDLLQAEGVLALLTAATPAALELGTTLVQGRASSRLRAAIGGIGRALQRLEAATDYPREAGAEDSVEELARGLRPARLALTELAQEPALANSPCLPAIRDAADLLRLALDAVDDGLPTDAVMGFLLRARKASASLTGSPEQSDELDRFFSRFPAGS